MFTQSLYNYYASGGYYQWLVDRVSKVIIIESVAMTYFFFACMFDWSTGTIAFTPHWWGIVLSILVASQGIVYIVRMSQEHKEMKEARAIYKGVGITDDMLSYAMWKDIAYKLVEQGVIDNELLIQCSVVREDNYIMGLMECGLLVGEKYMSEWYVTMLKSVIEQYLNDKKSFSKICITHGLISLFLTPYLIFYYLTYSAIKYAVAIYEKPSYLLEKRWSLRSMYLFRHYNELPHEIEARMRNAASLSSKYNSLFPSALRSKVSERLSFIISEVIIIMVVFLYLAPHANSHVIIKALTSALIAWNITQALIDNKSNKPNPVEVTTELRNVLMTDAMFHDKPNEDDYKKLNSLFIPRIIYALNEFIGILITPIYLIYIALYRDHVIASYIDTNTKVNDVIGTLFKGSDFHRDEIEMDTASKLMRSYNYYEHNYPMSQSIQYSKMLDSRFMDE